jgi:predicted transcriptional regulator
LSESELTKGRKPLDQRTKPPAEAMAHALDHWARLEVVTILHQGEFSAKEVADIMGEDVSYVAKHIRVLYHAGCIEFVEFRWIGTRARPVYRAVVLPEITDAVYEAMPKSKRDDAAAAMVQGFLAESMSSFRNKKMNGDEPPVLIWDAPPLDAQGRQKLRKRLTEVWDEEVLAIHGESDWAEILALQVLDNFAEVGVAFADGDRHLFEARSLGRQVAPFVGDEFKPAVLLGPNLNGLPNAYCFDSEDEPFQFLLVDVRADVGAGVDVDP